MASDGEDASLSQLLHALGRVLGQPARLLPVPVGCCMAQRSWWGGGTSPSACSAHCRWICQEPAVARLVPSLHVGTRTENDRSIFAGSAPPMIWLVFAAGVAAWWMTAALRRYALSRSLMDIPNARSSHCLPAAAASELCGGFSAGSTMAIAGPIAPSVVVGVLGAGGWWR